MKKILTVLLVCLFLLSGCGNAKPKDGIERPSYSGALQVKDGLLSDEKGNPIMLRGISFYGVSTMERFIKQETFDTIANDMHCNIVRMALYTYGVGTFGYCTGGYKDILKQDILNAAEYAKKSDMYCLIDWHILSDRDPNTYIEDAKEFFDYISSELKDEKHIIYEICNEPNGVEWQAIKDYANEVIPVIRNNDPDSVIIVGTPNWSSDLNSAVRDPLDYDNLMYTLHFYAASNKQDSRDGVQKAIDAGLPIFVTEFGITASTGNAPIDIEEADKWIDLLEDNNISYVMWNFSAVREASSALKGGTLIISDFSEDDYSTSGRWLIDNIAKRVEASQQQ